MTPFSDCISVISMHLEEDEEMMYGYGWLLCRGNNHAYVMTTCHLLSEIERDELKTLESKQRVYFPSSRSNENENYLDITNNSAVVSSDENSCLDYAVIRLRTSDKVCLEKPLTIARQCLSTGSSITPAGLMYEIHPGDVLPYPTDLVDWLKCTTRFGSRGDISEIPVLTCDPNVIYDWDRVEMNDCLFAYNAGIHNRRFSGCPLVDASDKVVGMHSFSVYIEECRDDKYVVSFGVRMEKIIEDINRKNPTLAKKCFSNSA